MTFWWQRWDQQYSHMASEGDLRGLTIERLRELCADKGITITARKKEELIAALMGLEGLSWGGRKPDPSRVAKGPSSADLFELILTMQRQQMA